MLNQREMAIDRLVVIRQCDVWHDGDVGRCENVSGIEEAV